MSAAVSIVDDHAESRQCVGRILVCRGVDCAGGRRKCPRVHNAALLLEHLTLEKLWCGVQVSGAP
jgi:hypothetical protein